MISSIDEIVPGDKLFPLFGLDEPYIATVNPYYVLHISGDMITWAYGGNCRPTQVKFGAYRLFKSLDDAKKYIVESKEVTWDPS